MINIGLIGFGYWGPNLARNFNVNAELKLAAICDYSSDRLEVARRLYPQVKLLSNLDYLYKDTNIDIIAIATPVTSHFELAKRALMSGRHVWLEKPMTEKVEQAEGALSRFATRQVTRVVLDTGTVTDLPQHLHVVTRARLQSLGLEQLLLSAEGRQAFVQLRLDAS